MLDSFAWEVFEEAGVLDLEFEGAACLAPQLSVDSRGRDLHFIEDLGVDSADALGTSNSSVNSSVAFLQSAELDSKGEKIPGN